MSSIDFPKSERAMPLLGLLPRKNATSAFGASIATSMATAYGCGGISSGRSMFVNIGTIQAADSEAELAGVMAHEMSHVYTQHSAKQQEKQSLLGGLAGVLGGLAGNMGGVWGTLAQGGIQFGAGTLMLKYSRGDEAQADSVGAIILWKANYSPEALADFFEKLEKQGNAGPQF